MASNLQNQFFKLNTVFAKLSFFYIEFMFNPFQCFLQLCTRATRTLCIRIETSKHLKINLLNAFFLFTFADQFLLFLLWIVHFNGLVISWVLDWYQYFWNDFLPQGETMYVFYQIVKYLKAIKQNHINSNQFALVIDVLMAVKSSLSN